MRAARITELTGPSSITAEDLDAPAPPEDGVVIDVRAAGVCFPDVLLSRGEYQMKPDPPFTPGCEVAGVVRTVGPRSRYAVGDRVAAFPFLGGFAEQVACADALTFALPDSVGFEAGAALPMNYFT
ncbi:MAG TPA: alcohol dehydrogenase catalytic domain-containing protein, partial [Anaerolineae bacterium]|nr:alcohol dehydrogenase catalytic domain-containing protein [Anaerolineae bacterium]